MKNSSGLAVLYERDAYSFQNKVMGRQSAGISFIKALAGTRPDKVWCYTGSRDNALALAQDLTQAGSPRTGVTWVPYAQPELLAEAGLLYRPDPIVAPEAWRRLTRASPRAYSVCGVTHTIASHGAMESITSLLTAPVEEWDAVICTSRVARDSLRVLIESQSDYLRERLGATRLALPQMPVIPLGVHCAHFSRATLGDAAPARAALGIAQDRVVVLFVGRLSFHGKAHPLPMYLGLERAARDAPITLVQAGLFANDAIRHAFEADARVLCPSVDYRIVDGRDAARMNHAWAAADIFTSLGDNVQETFGLTPLEAMAAGLPVVVSDWDGYKETVRHGIDGFRVPTLTPAPGEGTHLADRYDLGIDNYDYYCGHVGQFTAVDVEAAGEAYRRLALDPHMRASMGGEGRSRAAALFDWSVIFRRYQTLWDELAERRRSAPIIAPPLSKRRRPDRPDPFTVFASYPTAPIGPGTRFRLCQEISLATVAARRALRTIRFAGDLLPSEALVNMILEILTVDADGTGGTTAADLARRLPNRLSPERFATGETLHQALVWLAKIGAVSFSQT